MHMPCKRVPPVHSTSRKFSMHFAYIYRTFCLYFEITIFKILNIYASANDNYSLLRNVYKFFDVYECET